jgi:hypothetical protein
MNVNTALKEAIAKGVSKGTSKSFAALRKEIAARKRDLVQLRRAVKEISKKQDSIAAQMPKPDADDVASKFRRPSNGAAVSKIRAKLGLTQKQFAKLVKVSHLSVSK